VNIVRRLSGILLQKAAVALVPGLRPVAGSGGWWPRVLESFTGAWQRNIVVDKATVTANWAVFACVTLIASDVAKMPARVMQFSTSLKIWEPTLQRPVLRKPNRFQTRIEFFKQWLFSLLLHGNTYVLKERDAERKIVALYILDPFRVTPLVDPEGSVYYQLSADNLSGLPESVTVPASEIIHDRMHTLFHPLIGVSPIFACGVSAMQAAAIQENSAAFFQNMSRPSGILTAPGAISNETAARLKAAWQENFSGANIGKLAVLGDALKYEAMTISAVDSQLIEQLKFTGEMICATFHVPPYKLGLGAMPTVNNTAALNQQYYDQCLQPIAENMELRLDEGLELDFPFETWFDTTALLRMDPATRLDTYNKSISGGWLAPNEARRDEDKPPVEGGETPYMQQQNYSLASLARRDARDADGATDVQAAAMNGAQVTSLQALLVAVSDESIPADTARAAILAAFPLLTAAQVDAMINPLADFEPAEPDTPPAVEPDTQDEALDGLLAITRGFGITEGLHV
jgi:HK97 family phage portal protein